LLATGYFFYNPATAGSVLGTSTGAEVAHIFAGLEDHGWRRCSGLSHFAVEFCEIGLHPADAGEFNLAVLCDPEDGWDVGEAIGV